MTMDVEQFKAVVAEVMAGGDSDALAAKVSAHWQADQLFVLLSDRHSEIRQLGCLVLGLVGDSSSVGPLSACLHDESTQVRQLAENAMCTIWLRAGPVHCQSLLIDAITLAGHQAYGPAIDKIHKVVQLSSDFAEAWHQCGSIHYLLEEMDYAAEDYQQAVKLEPLHFNAWCGLANVALTMGETSRAIRLYRHGLAINPNMPQVAQLLAQLSD